MVERKWVVYSFAHLLAAAEEFERRAVDRLAAGQQEPWAELLAAVLFCALAMEGFLNHVGGQVYPYWDSQLDRLSPEAKLRLLAEKAAINCDFGARPFQTFRDLFKVRNDLAHPKTQELNWPIGMESTPKTRWESFCTPEMARRVVEDANRLITLLQGAGGAEVHPRFLLSEAVAGKGSA